MKPVLTIITATASPCWGCLRCRFRPPTAADQQQVPQQILTGREWTESNTEPMAHRSHDGVTWKLTQTGS